MAYMMEPTAEAYGTLLMRFRSLAVEGHCFVLKCIPCDIGKNPFLDCSMLNHFNTLSIYVSWLNHKPLRSISIDLNAQNI
jgi:hypothetical protein